MDEFFRLNGGWRPTESCTHCPRLCLQCFILQTTSDNPDPVKACSSCVALFRECSLAGPEKRQAATFETAQPVIGQLHGVYEDENMAQASSLNSSMHPDNNASANLFDVTTLSTGSKRSSSRSRFKTRPLRIWLANHSDHPYPSEPERDMLVHITGLSDTQVSNWFKNARRRQRQAAGTARHNSRKVFRAGSPMPRATASESTPMERWRNSPPEQEAASIGAIETALVEWTGSSHAASATGDAWDPSSATASVDSNSSASMWHASDSSSAASLAFSRASSNSRPTSANGIRKRQRGKRTTTASCILHCTFCSRTFTKKSDWTRRERNMHLPDLDAWICSDLVKPDESTIVWTIGSAKPQCTPCGQPEPAEAHIQTHDFASRADRVLAERKVYRKDHLWQHLTKFHHCSKWDGWTLDSRIESLRQQIDAVDSTCGFCQLQSYSWEARIEHIVQYFQDQINDISQWQGGYGIHDPGASW